MKINRDVSLLAAVMTLGFLAPSRADTYPRQPGVDIVNYAFHLTLSDDNDVIEGEAVVVDESSAAEREVGRPN